MSNDIKGVVVTFDHDLHEDTAARVIEAIKMIVGVASVHPSVSNIDDLMNREQVRRELIDKLFDVLVRKDDNDG